MIQLSLEQSAAVVAGRTGSKPFGSGERALSFRENATDSRGLDATGAGRHFHDRAGVTSIAVQKSIDQNVPDRLDHLRRSCLELRWPSCGVVPVELTEIVALVDAIGDRDATCGIGYPPT